MSPQSHCRHRQLRLVLAGIVIVGAVALLHNVGAAPTPFHREAQDARQPDVKAHGMLALTEGRLMLWSTDGRVEFGSPGVGWDPIIQLPMTYVVDVTLDAQGPLIAGSLHTPAGAETGVVIALGARGTILNRWTLGEAVVTSVATRSGERWVVARDRMWQLESDGAVIPKDNVAPGARVILPPAGREIVCTPADLHEAHSAFAHCARQGEAAWEAEGHWDRAPFLCGAWLIEPGRTSVTVRSIDSGRPMGEASIPPGAALLCSPDVQLIVARNRLEWFDLPGLVQRGVLPLPVRGIGAAVQQGRELILLTDSGRVVSVDLPN